MRHHQILHSGTMLKALVILPFLGLGSQAHAESCFTGTDCYQILDTWGGDNGSRLLEVRDDGFGVWVSGGMYGSRKRIIWFYHPINPPPPIQSIRVESRFQVNMRCSGSNGAIDMLSAPSKGVYMGLMPCGQKVDELIIEYWVLVNGVVAGTEYQTVYTTLLPDLCGPNEKGAECPARQ